MGSFNVGLQSDPNKGFTKVEIPTLLWEPGAAPAVSSPNLERLQSSWQRRDSAGRAEAEAYLLSHLNRRSPFANVGYLIFMALLRMGCVVDALAAARTNMSGDKLFGYSNVPGAEPVAPFYTQESPAAALGAAKVTDEDEHGGNKGKKRDSAFEEVHEVLANVTLGLVILFMFWASSWRALSIMRISPAR